VAEIKGGQWGDHNLQINLFAGEAPRGPVVAGNVPQAPPAFQPREDLMAQLRAAGPGVSVVRAVTGMRGVGKTQLAAAYARECINAGWRLVAWVNAEDSPSIVSGLAMVADRLGISSRGTDVELVATHVRNRLEADGDRCLLVFDNVADPDAVRPYVPSAGKSQVVVTSVQASALALGNPAPVDVFTEEESLAFLTERTGRHDSDGAKALAGEVGHLPLALAQAAAVIQAQRLTYSVYMNRLHEHPARTYLSRTKGDPYPRGVAEAILLSIDAAIAADPACRCGDLLAMISLLSPDGVARQILYFAESTNGAEAADEALGRLADASLLTFSDAPEPAVTAHRLVMRVARERCVQDATLTAVGTEACAMLAAAVGSLGEPWQHRTTARDLVRHVVALNDHLGPHVHADDKALTEALLDRRGWALSCLNALGDSAVQAIELGRPLVADDARALGEHHPETLAARSNLAMAYWMAARVDEAVPLLERTLADRERVLGADHPDTLMSRNNLGAVYRAAGRVDEAILLLEQTLADRERVLGADHPDTLMSQNNLAMAYNTADRGRESIELHERTLAARMRVLGEDHPDTLESRSNLAETYRVNGWWIQAVQLSQEALADRVRVLGENHPMTLTSRNNLAMAHWTARQEAVAIRMLEETLTDSLRFLGGQHHETLILMNHLAFLYERVGRVDAAIPLFEQALAGYRRAFGEEHRYTGIARNNLAIARRAAGQ
jgi:tetratricopeptide (TPR) repeat protein